MKKSDEKRFLCEKHKELLQIIVRYGRGAMLLAQLRAFCLAVGLYPSGQAVNRAVRELRAVDILGRQTWVDGRSDLVIARKAVYECLQNTDSQGTATPPRPATMEPYILQARKIDWLLQIVKHWQIDSLNAVDKLFLKQLCTVFLRQCDLLAYYQSRQQVFCLSRSQYDAEVKRLAEDAYRQKLWAGHQPQPENGRRVGPGATLKLLHQRGIYICDVSSRQHSVTMILFPERKMSVKKLMDWAIDACWWVRWTFPGYKLKLQLRTLDLAQKDTLMHALNARRDDQAYWHARLTAERIDGMLDLDVRNAGFVARWCGGVRGI